MARLKSASGTHRPTAAQVREMFAQASDEDLPTLVTWFRDDDRATVRALAASAARRADRAASERRRVREMYELGRSLGGPGLVLGLDEVGRGSVAGPLTVGAVALPDDPVVWGLNDSKQLAPQTRERLAAQIREVALCVGIGHVAPEEIDACGMAAALRMGMRRAIADAGVEPDAVLIDGNPVHVHPRETTIVHGDARVACIAAASIVAKVTRDAIMVRAEDRWPGYGFAASKGYASPEHIAAIREKGLTPYHRASFCHNFLADA